MQAPKLPSAPLFAALLLASPGANADALLYSQTDDYLGGGPTFTHSSSPGELALASDGADDFEVTDASGWWISEIGLRVAALPSGIPPDQGITVVFHVDEQGRPGTVVCSRPNVAPYEWQTTFGDHVRIALPAPCHLPSGRYWIALTANTTTTVRYWWGTTSRQIGEVALWRNPEDGLETGCTQWTPLMPTTCGFSWPPPGAYSFAFWLIGRSADALFADDFETPAD